MNKDLFLAILSMDSYNRSYGQGIKDLDIPTFDVNGNATSVVRIGNATIVKDSSVLMSNNVRQDILAGFYSIAYSVGAGILGLTGTVISYRGTDVIGTLPWTSEFWTGDLLNGYGLALGSYIHPQAILARQFYQNVAGTAGGANDNDVVAEAHAA